MFIDEDGFLTPPMEVLKVENILPGAINPMFVVLHGIEDVLIEDKAVDTAENAITLRSDNEYPHIVITPCGTILQTIGFESKACHCGASHWKGYSGLNGCSIGIYVIKNEEYTDEALDALATILPIIVKHYNIRDIINHSKCADMQHCSDIPEREFTLYTELCNSNTKGRFIVVAPEKLSVRGGPSPHFEIIDSLESGEAVKVLMYKDNDDWALILYERRDHKMKQGWVYTSFLRRL